MFRSSASDHSNDYMICICQTEVQSFFFFVLWFEQKRHVFILRDSRRKTHKTNSWEKKQEKHKIWKQPVHLNKNLDAQLQPMREQGKG